jgi:outer membrane receptor protein involved in Fe transport
MRILYLLAFFFVLSDVCSGQSGKISGTIIDAGSGKPLDGATITLIENSKTISADQNGNFSFGKLAAGKYSVKCSYTGHEQKIVDEIIVKDNDNTVITISLEQKKSDEVVVSATRTRAAGETVASLLVAQKNSANVSDGITAQQIKQTPDKSTSDVIKRVSGASIQDDRFAIIRGLNDRYNAAFINGAPLPSTESDRKAFAFDIFPSAILDNLVIYKTSTPDKSAEFAGGLIEITTKSIPAKNFTTLSFGASYNTLLTGKDRYYSENKGKTDWLGIDDGTRGTPAGIPMLLPYAFNALPTAEKGELAKLYKNYKWGIKHEYSTSPNYNFQLSKGFNIQRKQEDFLGALFSVNYNKNYTLGTGERNSFDNYNFDIPYYIPVQLGKYTDSIYNDEVVVSALANISVKIDNRNSISWKSNYSVNTDNKLLKRVGNPDYGGNPVPGNTATRVRFYTSNQIITSQLAGEHSIGKHKTKLTWLGAYTKVIRDIPNSGRTLYGGYDANASISSNPLQSYGNGVLFSSATSEDIKSFKYDITQPYTFMKNSQNFIKAGLGYQVRSRTFTSRALALAQPENVNFDNSLADIPDDQIFLPGHFGKFQNGKWGFVLFDATLPSANYTASSAITHVYLMSDQRFFKKFRLIYGVRMEDFNQKLNAIDGNRDTVNINETVTDFLPSVNFVYALTSKMNIRLSYATTVNRAEYRELAPFQFFDDVTNISTGGGLLSRAKIKNYDFRYEFFPGKSQLLSVSAFYKDFKKPIELIIYPNTSSQAAYLNSSAAYVYGAELEFRVLLSSVVGIKKENSFLSKFTLSVNAAYMLSNVRTDSFGAFPPSQLIKNRPLQGQSPYIINGSLSYNSEKLGLSSTLSANRVGDRLAIAGNSTVPNIFEQARTVIDFQLAKTFLKNTVELKLNIKDLLAQNISFYNDYDREKKLYSKEKDIYVQSYKAPTVISLSATIKL